MSLLAAVSSALQHGNRNGCTSEWLRNPHELAKLMRRHTKTDKATRHNYQFMYHKYMTPLVHDRCSHKATARALRVMEVGLGCGAMLPGGSVSLWQEMFSPPLDLELHVLEFDGDCVRSWQQQNQHLSDRVHVHVGDQGNATDLDSLYYAAGSRPFDVIIDDGPHINELQRSTLVHMIGRVAPGELLKRIHRCPQAARHVCVTDAWRLLRRRWAVCDRGHHEFMSIVGCQ